MPVILWLRARLPAVGAGLWTAARLVARFVRDLWRFTPRRVQVWIIALLGLWLLFQVPGFLSAVLCFLLTLLFLAFILRGIRNAAGFGPRRHRRRH